ncbi:unnamed protein product, partial [Discosporangium mesarthrocarpum]
GTYYFRNGDRYEGSWAQGERHGPGRYVDRNNNVERMEFVNGRRAN